MFQKKARQNVQRENNDLNTATNLASTPAEKRLVSKPMKSSCYYHYKFIVMVDPKLS